MTTTEVRGPVTYNPYAYGMHEDQIGRAHV